MKKQIALILSAASLLGLWTTTASAQAYAGGGLGAAHHRVDCNGFDCDRSSFGFKLYGGYRLNQYFAVEGSYTDFGDMKFSNPSYYNFKGRYGLTSFGLGAATFYDFHPKLTGVVRLGVASNRSTAKATYDLPLTLTAHSTKVKPYYGLGLGFRVTPRTTIELGADFTRYEIEDISHATRLVTLGLRQSF